MILMLLCKLIAASFHFNFSIERNLVNVFEHMTKD